MRLRYSCANGYAGRVCTINTSIANLEKCYSPRACPRGEFPDHSLRPIIEQAYPQLRGYGTSTSTSTSTYNPARLAATAMSSARTEKSYEKENFSPGVREAVKNMAQLRRYGGRGCTMDTPMANLVKCSFSPSLPPRRISRPFPAPY